MKLKLLAIPETEEVHTFELDREWMRSVLEDGLDPTFKAELPLRAEAGVLRSGPEVYVRGRLKTGVQTVCSRCLAEARLDISAKFSCVFKERTEELQEAEDRYRTIFEKAPVGIFSIDKQGFVTAINPYQLEVDGGEPEDFIGKFNTLGYSQINNPYMYEKFSEMLEGRPFEVKDLLNNTPEGNQIYINMSGNPVFDTEGNCIGGILMMEDVTERVHLQERLLRTEKLAAIGKLASGVGHELRNPLGVIKNSVYFLKMVLGSSDEKVGRHLEIQNREIDISNRIITILMEFSKLRSSNVESFDMNSLIMESLSKIDIPDNVELELELEEGRIDIVADRVQIGGVLINIITNAVQAMPLGGRLKIGIERMGGFIRIEVVDTGEGMSEETVKDIFEPLYTTKAKGIGLGLAIARQYVENHNGKIGVKSKPGKGSVFSIKLPLRKS